MTGCKFTSVLHSFSLAKAELKMVNLAARKRCPKLEHCLGKGHKNHYWKRGHNKGIKENQLPHHSLFPILDVLSLSLFKVSLSFMCMSKSSPSLWHCSSLISSAKALETFHLEYHMWHEDRVFTKAFLTVLCVDSSVSLNVATLFFFSYPVFDGFVALFITAKWTCF